VEVGSPIFFGEPANQPIGQMKKSLPRSVRIVIQAPLSRYWDNALENLSGKS